MPCFDYNDLEVLDYLGFPSTLYVDELHQVVLNLDNAFRVGADFDEDNCYLVVGNDRGMGMQDKMDGEGA